MMSGILVYDDISKRFVINALDSNGVFTGESMDLHCGDCLSVSVSGSWVDTRIEFNSSNDADVFGWYFVGIGYVASFIGHRATI